MIWITPWTAEQWAQAQAMARRGASAEAIGEAFGRTPLQIRNRFANKGLTMPRYAHLCSRGRAANVHRLTSGTREAAEAAQHEDALRRQELRWRQGITSRFFGDPPPGYSALDKKRGVSP